MRTLWLPARERPALLPRVRAAPRRRAHSLQGCAGGAHPPRGGGRHRARDRRRRRPRSTARSAPCTPAQASPCWDWPSALGILIGSAGDDQPRQVAAAPPQVITVAAPAAGQPVAQEFTGDWPDGTDGYTVQLRTLPKDGTEVAAVQAAKSRRAVAGSVGGGRARLGRLLEPRRRQLRDLRGRLQVAQAGQEGAARAEGRLPGREGRAGVGERRRARLARETRTPCPARRRRPPWARTS